MEKIISTSTSNYRLQLWQKEEKQKEKSKKIIISNAIEEPSIAFLFFLACFRKYCGYRIIPV